MKYLFSTLAIVCLLSSCETTDSTSTASNASAPAQTKPASKKAEPKKETTPSGVKPYNRSTCIVTGEKLGSKGMVITEVYKGQEFKVCCEACHIAFKMDKEFYLAKM